MLYFLLIVGLLLTHCTIGDDKVLNEFINYYEPVMYTEQEEITIGVPWLPISVKTDEATTMLKAESERRSSMSERVDIRAFGRVYKLELKHTMKVLGSDTQITILGGQNDCIKEKMNIKSILTNLVEGKVSNEPKSYVHGALKKGIFTGVIYLQNQTLFVERASKYFREKMPFDCVIFRQEDLNMTAFDCGMGPDGYKCDPIRLLQRTGPTTHKVTPVVDEVDASREHSWFKRHSPKTTCALKVVADHLFYQHAGDGSAENAIYEMIFHVHEADRIFRATDFDQDGQSDNVGFKIEAVEVYTSTACFENPALAKTTITSDQYLEMFSERDFHNYCVGVAFSGYTFPGRVLGIAWMADADNSGYVGGICEPRLYSTQDQKALSFNSAVITMMLEGRRMPRGITAIAVAHELGHSFGSDHDPYQDPICSPTRENGGKFIMAAFAVKGDQPNNRYFSPCSKHNMRTVLKKKGTCFTSVATSYCVKTESNKKCTNDIPTVANADICCSSNSLEPNTETSNHQTGKLPRNRCPCPPDDSNAQASTCCDDLQISDSDCTAPESLCENAGWCPSPAQKMPDGSLCSNGLGECWNGDCVIDQCILLAQVPCECSEPDNACIVCCKKDADAVCKPIQRKDTPWWLLRRPGELCQRGIGECDKYGKCGLRPQDLIPIVNKTTMEELNSATPIASSESSDQGNEMKITDFDDFPESWDWISYENGENNEYNFSEVPKKINWWKKIFVQIMWICLGVVMFLTMMLCVCFICPAVAVGIWCLRQCACLSERSADNNFLLREPEGILPTGIFYQSTDGGHSMDLPPVAQCPIPDIQTRSRTF